MAVAPPELEPRGAIFDDFEAQVVADGAHSGSLKREDVDDQIDRLILDVHGTGEVDRRHLGEWRGREDLVLHDA